MSQHTIFCPDCRKDISWEDRGNPRNDYDHAMIQCDGCGGLWSKSRGWFDSLGRMLAVVDRFTGNEKETQS